MGIKSNLGLRFRTMKTGKNNLITDVAGITVGHKTLNNDPIHTGVTVLIPHGGDLYHDKCPAAVHVINGYGKSAGLVQVGELCTIETPLFFTNTLSVGTVLSASVRYMLEKNPDIGRDAGSVNSIVFECNDGTLNDLRSLAVQEEDAFDALNAASVDFQEGSVGAGTGMCCYGLKGGIGSSSRIVEINGEEYTVGALLLTNFGVFEDLIVAGETVGQKYLNEQPPLPDKGSCIIVLATDAPVSDRQLLRLAKRAQSGLARTGCFSGNGSGELALAFSTNNRIPHYSPKAILQTQQFHDDDMDLLFHATIECVEESVISSMLHAEHMVGREGTVRYSLSEILSKIGTDL